MSIKFGKLYECNGTSYCTTSSSYYTFETLCDKSKEAYLSTLTWKDDHKDCLVKKTR